MRHRAPACQARGANEPSFPQRQEDKGLTCTRVLWRPRQKDESSDPFPALRAGRVRRARGRHPGQPRASRGRAVTGRRGGQGAAPQQASAQAGGPRGAAV
eukprot:6304687-Prymnesium_polylepis.1